MKTGIYSILYAVVLNMAIGSCFLPFIFLSWKKMRQVKTYRIIGLYWLLSGFINIIDLDLLNRFINISAGVKERLNCCYDMLDTPLALLIFASAVSGRQRKQILLVLLLFIAGEVTLIGWKGYNAANSNIIIGVGLLLAILCCITGLVQYMKKMEHTPFENSMVFVYSALIFDYGSYLILYIFSLIRDHSDSKDSSMVYYTSLLLSAAFTSMGLWGYGIRRPQVAV
ncbi:MAG TPA: hypothetical protein VNS58_16395 [Puia sp.]|nr:hypothetical protein [Puia sp.]